MNTRSFEIATIWFVAPLFVIVCGVWVRNAYKLAHCDFWPDYKCEVIHGAGVFMPPLSLLTVWFDDDREAGR